jgi:hypothetical protein
VVDRFTAYMVNMVRSIFGSSTRFAIYRRDIETADIINELRNHRAGADRARSHCLTWNVSDIVSNRICGSRHF